MKKIISIILLLNYFTSLIAVGKEAADLMGYMATWTGAAFPSGANLVLFRKEQPIGGRVVEQDPIEGWNTKVIKPIGAFIDKNASELKKYFNELNNINNDFINRKKIIFNTYIAPAIIGKNEADTKMLKATGIKTIDRSKLDFNKLYSNIALIKADANPVINKLEPLVKMQNELSGVLTKYRASATTRAIKGDAVEVLLGLAKTLEVVISKYRDDIKKLQSAVTAAKGSVPAAG